MDMKLAGRRLLVLFLGLLFFSVAGAQSSVQLSLVTEGAASVSGKLMRMGKETRVKLDGLDLGGASSVTADLQRFEITTPESTLVVHGDQGVTQQPLPQRAYYYGSLAGQEDSHAFLAVGADGALRGIVRRGEDLFVLDAAAGGVGRSSGRLQSRRVSAAEDFSGQGFQCGVTTEFMSKQDGEFSNPMKSLIMETHRALRLTMARSVQYRQANIIIETDYELFQKFGSATTTSNYVTDLLAYVSSLYETQIGTRLVINQLNVYSSSSDPWSGTDTSTALAELKTYWNTSPRNNVSRNIVHMISGKAYGGGLAYMGTLCSPAWSYGVSMGLSGQFSASNPTVIWDSVVVAHELGHNFGSDHTHNFDSPYAGDSTGGAIDCCYSDRATGQCGTANGGASKPGVLPGTGSVTGGTAGNGNGSIMSYCHLLGGGYGNLTMTFGTGFSYGVNPGREAAVMISGAQSCLPVMTVYSLTVTPSGSGTVTSSPSGIRCGSTCTAGFNAGASATLTATPVFGGSFVGWSGNCSGSGSTCNLSMMADMNVGASFSSYDFPGNGSLPANWSQGAGSSAAWVVDNTTSNSGTYSLRSGTIGNSQLSSLSYTATFADGTISFARRVSSEASWDFLNFYIDGVLQGSWSGTVPWGTVSVAISAGSHTITWEYKKDSIGSAGSDAAWIDDVSLPVVVASTGTVEFSGSSVSVLPTVGNLVLTVNRVGTGSASVNYATANGTASAGTDYTATSGTLNWSAGDTSSRTITVPILNAGSTGSKTFQVALSSPSAGVSLGTTSSVSVTIIDNRARVATQVIQWLELLFQ